MTTNPLDKFAPYPDENTATADALARHFTTIAQGRNAIIGELVGYTDEHGRRAYMEQVNLFVDEYAIAALLRALIEHAPEAADKVARGLLADWRDGGVMPELLWEWLAEYRIPPREVSDAAVEAWRGKDAA